MSKEGLRNRERRGEAGQFSLKIDKREMEKWKERKTEREKERERQRERERVRERDRQIDRKRDREKVKTESTAPLMFWRDEEKGRELIPASRGSYLNRWRVGRGKKGGGGGGGDSTQGIVINV